MGMTRSDLLLETHKAYDFLDKISVINEINARKTINLIHSMHNKIENAYQVIFALEKDEHFKELGEELRKRLETDDYLP